MNKNFKVFAIMAIMMGLLLFVGCDSKYARDYSSDQEVTIVDEMTDEELIAKSAEGQKNAGHYFNYTGSNTFLATELGDACKDMLTTYDLDSDTYETVKYKVFVEARTNSENEESFEGYIKKKVTLYYQLIDGSKILTKEINQNVYFTNQAIYMQNTMDDKDDENAKGKIYELGEISESGQFNFDLIATTFFPLMDEKGTDEKGNIIAQSFCENDEGQKEGLRLVLDSSGKLVFVSGIKTDAVTNIDIDYKKKTINFPDDLDSYDDSECMQMSPLTIATLLFVGMI